VELPAPGYRSSRTVTRQPSRRSSTASASPAMPAPTTTTSRMSGEIAQGDGVEERPCRGRCGVDALLAQDGEDGGGAELPLARAGHRAGAALDELHVAEAVRDAGAEVADPDVLAEAGEGVVGGGDGRHAGGGLGGGAAQLEPLGRLGDDEDRQLSVRQL